MNEQEITSKTAEADGEITPDPQPGNGLLAATETAVRDYQTQAERFLRAQAEQIRQRVKAEMHEIETRLHEKDELLHNVASRITDLQLQLAEKQLILDARNIEVNDLKAIVSKLSHQMAELRRAAVVNSRGAESQAQAAATNKTLGEKEWTLEEQATAENRNPDYSLGEPTLTVTQKVRLSTFQDLSGTPGGESEKKHFATSGRRWRAQRGWKRRWKIWS